MGDTALGMARPALSDAGTGPVSRHSRKPGRFIPSEPRRDRPGSLPRSSADQRERDGERPPGNADLDGVARNIV